LFYAEALINAEYVYLLYFSLSYSNDYLLNYFWTLFELRGDDSIEKSLKLFYANSDIEEIGYNPVTF